MQHPISSMQRSGPMPMMDNHTMYHQSHPYMVGRSNSMPMASPMMVYQRFPNQQTMIMHNNPSSMNPHLQEVLPPNYNNAQIARGNIEMSAHHGYAISDMSSYYSNFQNPMISQQVIPNHTSQMSMNVNQQYYSNNGMAFSVHHQQQQLAAQHRQQIIANQQHASALAQQKALAAQNEQFSVQQNIRLSMSQQQQQQQHSMQPQFQRQHSCPSAPPEAASQSTSPADLTSYRISAATPSPAAARPLGSPYHCPSPVAYIPQASPHPVKRRTSSTSSYDDCRVVERPERTQSVDVKAKCCHIGYFLDELPDITADASPASEHGREHVTDETLRQLILELDLEHLEDLPVLDCIETAF